MPDSPQARKARAASATRKSKLTVSADELLDALGQSEREELSAGNPRSDRYPENQMPIAGAQPRPEMWSAGEDDEHLGGAQYDAALERYELFSSARERLLINYRHNTARAYWGDLDDIFFWCEHRDLDIFDLTDRDLRQYVGLLRRRTYSENTIRRRGVAYRQFRRVVDAEWDSD